VLPRAFALCACLLPYAAPAAPKEAVPTSAAPRLLVLGVSEDALSGGPAGRLEVDLHRALEAKGASLVDLDRAFPPPPGATLERGDALFEAGREAYNNLDPDSAANRFTQAASFYAHHPELAADRLSRTLIFLGATYLLQGDQVAANDAFTRAVLLDAGASPDGRLFGREVRKAFDRAKAQLGKARTGSLTVDSIPGGGRVVVGRQELGLGPTAPVELKEGRHRVVITRPGYQTVGAFPEVVAGRPAEFRPTLEPNPGLEGALELAGALAKAPEVPAAVPPEAGQLAARVAAQRVVLAKVRTDATGMPSATLIAWDPGARSALVGLTAVYANGRWVNVDELSRQVHQWRPDPIPLAGRPRSPSRAVQAPSLLRQWWFWAAVGGTVAAGAGAAVAVGSDRPGPPSFITGIP
jgi:hypothetical protein